MQHFCPLAHSLFSTVRPAHVSFRCRVHLIYSETFISAVFCLCLVEVLTYLGKPFQHIHVSESFSVQDEIDF